MKIERIGNSYRVRKMIKGKSYCISFDHKPTKSEIEEALRSPKDRANGHMTFKDAGEEMIRIKSNVISPASVRKYNTQLKGFSDWFLGKYIDDITSADVQREINMLSASRAAKTVKDYYGFISSVFAILRPETALHIKLPTEQKKEPYIPSTDDIKRILEEAEGTDFELPIMLGCFSMRRSEICALTPEDIEGNVIHISKAMVLDENTKWVIKSTKTTASTRDIVVPDKVIQIINERGLYTGHPNSLNKALERYQKKLGIERFSFHKLRHFFASEAHSKGIPDADIMKFGGWETDSVMKSVYRHSMNDSQKVMDAIDIF